MSVRRLRTPVLLVSILGVAAAVRLWNLNAVGFNSDEAVYAGQGASLAGNPNYTPYFPVFRAHPMLVQTLLSLIFREGEHDLAGRVLIAGFGVATVAVVFLLGRELYSSATGLVAAAILAVMPYHVVVTRQVLLDGPMVFFSTLTLWCVVRFAKTGRLVWMVTAGAALGLTMLAKESSIVLAGAVYAFLALTPSIKRPIIGTLMGCVMIVAVFAVHPVSQSLAGHTSTAKAYLVWQLVRRPNHSYLFYAEVVPAAVGFLVLLAAFLAVWKARKGPAWREVLLASWAIVPAIAFTIWPVKGFQYLLPGAPAVAILAARGLLTSDRTAAWVRRALPGRLRHVAVARLLMVSVVLASLVYALMPSIGPHQGATGLAGSGGIAGGREAGRWIRENTPPGSVFMTLGPSMANLVGFYGHREAYGLSVSPNPLKRNPSYVPLENPDASLRHGDLQYIVWDIYSADRSTYFSGRLNQLARRYHGRKIHTETAVKDGREVPVVVIYQVRP
jgi:4-amino-4-deoxy-L-arabinose transferase-like glycosyltransferase